MSEEFGRKRHSSASGEESNHHRLPPHSSTPPSAAQPASTSELQEKATGAQWQLTPEQCCLVPRGWRTREVDDHTKVCVLEISISIFSCLIVIIRKQKGRKMVVYFSSKINSTRLPWFHKQGLFDLRRSCSNALWPQVFLKAIIYKNKIPLIHLNMPTQGITDISTHPSYRRYTMLYSSLL